MKTIDLEIFAILETEILVVLFPIIADFCSEIEAIFYERLLQLSILSQMQEERQATLSQAISSITG
jgi:hypothetical protein